MSDEYDSYDHVEDCRDRAEKVVEKFRRFEHLEDAIDAFAQEQIEIGNEVQASSDAESHAGLEDTEERAAAIRECDVRHEIGQALQGLLQSYEYEPHQSVGKDPQARKSE